MAQKTTTSKPNIWLHSLKIASLGGLFYMLGLILVHSAGKDLSTLPDWFFRFSFILFIIWGVWNFRVKQKGWLSFPKGFAVGMIITVFLNLYIVGATWVFREQIAPEYNTEARKLYEYSRTNQMTIAYLKEHTEKQKMEEEDHAKIKEGLRKHMEDHNGGYFFTTSGAMIASSIYGLVWGLCVAFTIAYMARNVKED